ncbi:MAG: hypothetical protein V7709_07160 [Halioglobus sp.]
MNCKINIVNKRRLASLTAELLAVGCLALSSSAWAQEENANEGRWSFTPYVWLMDTAMDVSIHDQSIEQEIKFTDVIDKVEIAFQGHLERNTDRFGLFADVTYFSIADDVTEHGVKLDADIKLEFYEVGALYHLSGNSLTGISVLGGLRHVASEQDIELQGEGEPGLQHSSSNSVGLTDAMLGARYVRRISDRWQLGFRGDYSVGDTEGTWNFQALIGRQFQTKRIRGSALFGYRYMQMDIEDGPLESEYTLSGPIVGMRIEF